MEGVYIGKSRGATWASVSALIATASIAAAIFLGPAALGAISAAGLLIAGVGLVLAIRSPSLEKPVVFPCVMIGVHALFLLTAAVLHSMFLSPLSPESRKMPILQTPYADSSGVFEFKGPAGWDYRPAPSEFESGVRLQPSDQDHYMGVSEATVFVRRLDTAPVSQDQFLKKAAAAFSEKGAHRKLFDLQTDKGVSLSGVPVIWSELTVKRFWVPIYQVSVFGIKNNRYLCSVSATGLKSHSDLSHLLCLGLFERIKITQKAGSSPTK